MSETRIVIEQMGAPDVVLVNPTLLRTVDNKADMHPAARLYVRLDLFKTSAGRLAVIRSRVDPKTDEVKAQSVVWGDEPQDIVKQLGFGWLSKELYDEMGWPHAEEL